MDTLEAIQNRKSTRVYSLKDVPKELIEKIVDAGRMAATARNIQPWEFVVIRDKEKLKKMASWAENGRFIEQAPVCIAVFCKETKYYLEDGSAATENMLLAATALGVQSCWVAGDKKDYAADVAGLLKASNDLKLVSLIPLGYEPKSGKRAPKRSLNEVLHWETLR